MGARILVIDDEEALLQLLQKYLARLGYTVDIAANASEGWAKFEQDTAAYSVAMIDLTLPDEPGEHLMERMLASSDSLRVLLCSGYPYETEQAPQPLRRRIAFLQKPFLPRHLAEELTRLLKR
jgi:DNA-binding NtrC family response regulator